MTMKPYVVRITVEKHIFAENEEEAKKEAEEYVSLGDAEVVKGSAEIVHRYTEYTTPNQPIPSQIKFVDADHFLSRKSTKEPKEESKK